MCFKCRESGYWAIRLGDKSLYCINTQGTGYIDYDLGIITAIGGEFTGYCADGTKLTSEKALPKYGMESCNILVRFGDFPNRIRIAAFNLQ